MYSVSSNADSAGNGVIRVFSHQFFALFKTIQADEGVLLPVHAGGFSQLRLGADHVQHIVPDLERQPQPAAN